MERDDDLVSLASYDVGSVSLDEEPGDLGMSFWSMVESAQRLGLMRNQAEYVRGSAVAAHVDKRSLTPEKVFSVGKLFTWESGEPETLLDALRRGRVRARVQANTGLGKSTRLPWILADGLQARVLVVAVNAHALRQNSEYVRLAGIGRVRKSWGAQRESRVCFMTYADFNGYCMSGRRGDMFRSFEVMIFDEAFESGYQVYCAKRNFSAFATPEVSLLLCSATISTDALEEGAGSAAMGNFRTVASLTLEEMLRSGKLATDYATDRGYIVLPTDEEVAQTTDYLQDYGYAALMLDSASSYDDFVRVLSDLRGDSEVPRILVMHSRWGLGFNMQVEFGVVRPFVSAWVEKAGTWVEEQFAMTEESVLQVKARSGRGFTDSSSGIIVGSERSERVELYEFDKDQAFVMLCACSIIPIKKGFWDAQYAKFPDGLPAAVAQLLMRINLPVGLSYKFLAEDGFIAGKYARAISMFTQVDHYIRPSVYELPKTLGEWVDDEWVDENMGIRSHATVPAIATGELRVILHGLHAIAEERRNFVRWRPEQMRAIGDYDSDDGAVAVRTPHLRRPEKIDRPVVGSIEEVTVPTGFRLTVEGDPAATKRAARLLSDDRVKEALRAMEMALRSTDEVVETLPVVQSASGSVVEVPLVNEVESPGGSLVCELPAGIYESMNVGEALGVAEVSEIMTATKGRADRFAASKLFDGFSKPWTSFLFSVSEVDVFLGLQRKGLVSQAYDIVQHLCRRFDFELVNALALSNTTRGFVERLLGRNFRSAKVVMEAVLSGKFDRFAQSRRFFERVRVIRSMLDACLLVAEEHGLYLPLVVSENQRMLGGKGRAVRSVGAELSLPDKSLGSALGDWSEMNRRLVDRFKIDRVSASTSHRRFSGERKKVSW